ncbi:hypothetical protein [Streptomyces sp. WZ-12]|uniref:hypothetical protein n=1 Tax=Streptomyces sp. WZ-12 TaxID=3030210 RepID=UPI0023811669|nr:hypothetical protein [Streptomyces sp. WZ-12]
MRLVLAPLKGFASVLKGFARFWYAFLVGDDWKIAATVLVVLLLGLAALFAGAPPGGLLAAILALLLMAGFAGMLLADARRHKGS